MSKNLVELAREIPGISINASFTDLIEAFRVVADEHKRELEEIVLSDKAESYPTVKQVSEMLNVNASTLWRWAQKKYLVPIEFGGGRRYKMSEVKALMNGGRAK